jgi:hypothetical protein
MESIGGRHLKKQKKQKQLYTLSRHHLTRNNTALVNDCLYALHRVVQCSKTSPNESVLYRERNEQFDEKGYKRDCRYRWHCQECDRWIPLMLATASRPDFGNADSALYMPNACSCSRLLLIITTICLPSYMVLAINVTCIFTTLHKHALFASRSA